jgi:uncharacterized RDD family membrane protein YckC
MSAAQNGAVIEICSHCGALLMAESSTCSFCDRPLRESESSGYIATSVLAAGSIPTSAPAEATAAVRASVPSNAVEPEWRVEVSRRLREYRRRRGQTFEDDSQSGLPFTEETSFHDDFGLPLAISAEPARPRASSRFASRSRHSERVEICIQPELDFSAAAADRACPQTALVPVASLSGRRKSALLDAIFLMLTYAGFLGLFRSLGGQLLFQKIDAAVCFSAFFLFYALYCFIFTTFAGATPGMMLRELTIVRLDGSLPDTRQLLWRSFGCVLSGATLFLGFLWALWDEDGFTWQDRISQTYITSTEPLVYTASLPSRSVRQGYAHK